MKLAGGRVLPHVDVERHAIDRGPAGGLLARDRLRIEVKHGGHSACVLVGDLIEPGAQLGEVLLRIAARLVGGALAARAQLVGDPAIEAIEQAAVAAKRVGPRGVANQRRELLEPATGVVAARPHHERRGDPGLVGVRVVRRDRRGLARRWLDVKIAIAGAIVLERGEQLLGGERGALLQAVIDRGIRGHRRLELGHGLREREPGVERRVREQAAADRVLPGGEQGTFERRDLDVGGREPRLLVEQCHVAGVRTARRHGHHLLDQALLARRGRTRAAARRTADLRSALLGVEASHRARPYTIAPRPPPRAPVICKPYRSACTDRRAAHARASSARLIAVANAGRSSGLRDVISRSSITTS
ncbi:MAG TPA: hypothetical protein VFP84_23120 [Kofleriaceae bacterium]|nr:hypothetical protein [Kofleriaceae bacterium]